MEDPKNEHIFKFKDEAFTPRIIALVAAVILIAIGLIIALIL